MPYATLTAPDAFDDLNTPQPRLEDQAKTSNTYRVHAEVGTSLNEMFSHVLTINTPTGLSLTDEDVLTPDMRRYMEHCTGITLRYASNAWVQQFSQI